MFPVGRISADVGVLFHGLLQKRTPDPLLRPHEIDQATSKHARKKRGRGTQPHGLLREGLPTPCSANHAGTSRKSVPERSDMIES